MLGYEESQSRFDQMYENVLQRFMEKYTVQIPTYSGNRTCRFDEWIANLDSAFSLIDCADDCSTRNSEEPRSK